ncbi:hypothetical protein ACHWQZ_G012091 [Mnemiopsis leidyi]
MAIFGVDILLNGTEVHDATILDIVLDHVFVVLSIILLIISCVCNPIVFWFHRKMKQNTPAVLFQILTANDFLTCLLMVPVMLYYLVSGDLVDNGRPGEINTWQILYSATSSTMFCWSFSLTAILGTVRCAVIHYPFLRINKVLVLTIAVGMVMFSAGGSAFILVPRSRDEKFVWVSSCMAAFPERYVINPKMTLPLAVVYVKSTGNMAVSLCTAVLSVWGLKKAKKLTKDTGKEKIRGGKEAAMTIVLLNILVCLQFKLVVTSAILQYGFPEKMVLGSLMTIFGDDILWDGTTIYQANTADQIWNYVFVKPPDLARPDVPSTWQVFYTMIKGTMFCWSFSLTAILGTVRCIAIHFPFLIVNKALVLSIAIFMGFFTFGMSLAIHFSDDEHVWSPFSLQVFPRNYITGQEFPLAFIVVYIKAAGNVVVSLGSASLSVLGLKRADNVQKSTANEKQSGKEAAMTIAYLNVMIGLDFILIIMTIIVHQIFSQHVILSNYVFFLALPVANTLISAINPLIYIVRCSKIRRGLLTRGPSQISRTSYSINTTA